MERDKPPAAPPSGRSAHLLQQRFATAYVGTPPWDIDGPQPALVAVAREVDGAVLDVGCGTGENALFFSARGHEVWGVDVVPTAIERARDKARARRLPARFEVGDVLALQPLGRRFETLIDSGLFHMFDDAERALLVSSLERLLVPEGTCHLLCFREAIPGTVGPRPVTPEELRATFSRGWRVQALREAHFQMRPPLPSPRAWLASVRYTP
jgi:SAM-dependent methyltransferase